MFILSSPKFWIGPVSFYFATNVILGRCCNDLNVRAHPQQYFANDLSGRTGLKALHGIFCMNDEGYRHQLLALKLEHRDLDDAIAALRAVGSTDQLQIARLKKKKLGLKDQIMRLEDQLIPDIIA